MAQHLHQSVDAEQQPGGLRMRAPPVVRPYPKGATHEARSLFSSHGGELYRSMLELRLVDAVELAVIPVLLGGGVPLLPHPARQVTLTLVRHHIYPKTGTVWLEYEPG